MITSWLRIGGLRAFSSSSTARYRTCRFSSERAAAAAGFQYVDRLEHALAIVGSHRDLLALVFDAFVRDGARDEPVGVGGHLGEFGDAEIIGAEFFEVFNELVGVAAADAGALAPGSHNFNGPSQPL